jgi:hypothetical protein
MRKGEIGNKKYRKSKKKDKYGQDCVENKFGKVKAFKPRV